MNSLYIFSCQILKPRINSQRWLWWCSCWSGYRFQKNPNDLYLVTKLQTGWCPHMPCFVISIRVFLKFEILWRCRTRSWRCRKNSSYIICGPFSWILRSSIIFFLY